MWQYINTEELYHHGVKGQKWGVQKAKKYTKRYNKWDKAAQYAFDKSIKSAKKNTNFLNRQDGAKDYGLGKKFEAKANKVHNRLTANGVMHKQSTELIRKSMESGKYYKAKSKVDRVKEFSLAALSGYIGGPIATGFVVTATNAGGKYERIKDK